ncbi:MAG TPA: hypothetical protein VJ960_07605 [Oceanipulchritudo sp.]|nr:hypothetical protein [Oceanipulchritudo sp.]
MKLTDEQNAAVAGWLREGASLSEVQKRLESEFEIRMTYMDLRFMVDDLDLEIQSEAPKFDDPVPAAVPGGEGGGVSVTLDKVSRPDALVSGQVTFSDGQSAQWHLDQMGRLAMNPKQPGYKPSDTDLQKFQEKLREAVEKSGMF